MQPNSLVKIALSIGVITIILILAMLFSNKKNTTNISPSTKLSLSFLCQQINDNGNRILMSEKTVDNNYHGKFELSLGANIDAMYNVILIKNYEQSEFTINKDGKKYNHKILVPQNENGVVNTTIDVNIENLSEGVNDCALIFILDDSSVSESTLISQGCFVSRFTIINNTLAKPQMDIYSDFNSIPQPLPFEIDMFNRKSQNNICLASSKYKINNNGSVSLNKNEANDIPVRINLGQNIIDSPFYSDFIQDSNSNEEQSTVIVGIVNNKIVNLGDNNNVMFMNTKLNESISFNLYNKFPIKEQDQLILLAFYHPYSLPDDLLNTYKISQWSSPSISNRLYLDQNC